MASQLRGSGKMKRYVVTGGAGFIGSTLVRQLVAQGDGEVAVIDNLLTGYEKNLEDVAARIDFLRLDIRDYAALAQVLRRSGRGLSFGRYSVGAPLDS